MTDLHFIPVSAKVGDNVARRSENLAWYQGGPLLDYLETVNIASDRNLIDLRFPIQYVIRPDLDFRGYAGTVSSGIVRRGDEVVALPSGKRSRIRSIHSWEGELNEAFAAMAVTLTWKTRSTSAVAMCWCIRTTRRASPPSPRRWSSGWKRLRSSQAPATWSSRPALKCPPSFAICATGSTFTRCTASRRRALASTRSAASVCRPAARLPSTPTARTARWEPSS